MSPFLLQELAFAATLPPSVMLLKTCAQKALGSSKGLMGLLLAVSIASQLATWGELGFMSDPLLSELYISASGVTPHGILPCLFPEWRGDNLKPPRPSEPVCLRAHGRH